jgi:type VI secretion system secreted protein VgrG
VPWIAISHADPDGQPMADQRYSIHFEDGTVIKGSLDAQGQAHHDNVPKRGKFVDYEPRQPDGEAPWDSLNLLVQAAQAKLG